MLPVEIQPLVFAVLAFLAVVLTLEGLYHLWVSHRGAEARRIRERLATQAGPEARRTTSLERAEARDRVPALAAALDLLPPGRRLVRWVRAAGSDVGAGELLLVSIFAGGLGVGLVRMVERPWVLGLALGIALAAMPWWWVSRRRTRRTERFERQFPEALDLMARAMRAGHSFSNAVQMAGDELPAPLGAEFRLMFDELNYGVPLSEAMLRLSARVPLPDVSYFAIAVMIQRESGGNLAELLDKISSIVRARLKLRGDVRTLSAEGKLSAWILTLLPFVLAAVIMLIPSTVSSAAPGPSCPRIGVARAMFDPTVIAQMAS